MGLLNEGQVQEALHVQRAQGGPLGEILVARGAITADQLMVALGAQAGMEVVRLAGVAIPPAVVAKIDNSTCNLFRVVPVREQDGVLVVAMADPMNAGILDDLRFLLNQEVRGVVAPAAEVEAALQKYYPEALGGLDRAVKETARDERAAALARTGPLDLADAEAMAKSPPVVKLLNYVLFQAIRDQASDIHLEPFEDDFKVRYRIDGVLYELESPPRHLAEALTSRIKVMADLDIAETRAPQDGRIELVISGRPVDIRVSTLPTLFGESCVMRVLDRSVVSLDLQKIGLRDAELEAIRSLIHRPHGIILVTGPTGSGKTTTLYSALNEANDVGIKIITTEDPVEYDLEGIVQVQIHEDIGLTYARCLRAILRQDPDKILVGEIRDEETGRMAVEASLTGHVVFSTLHTNDAPSAITRMIDIGVESFLLAATLEAVVAQRLVRRICPDCSAEYTPSPDVLAELGLTPREVAGRTFRYGKGCAACHHTGYRGRHAIFEILLVSERLRQMITENLSTDRIREAALEEGMRTLRDAGLLAIYDGITTVEEVIRATVAET
ncbi:MAG: Flp pilus assembly complex ATPase component TadA [Planctomycetes bacterium]|nr:Flp pilus assembly complex ATPase component TadA [Planctomycetota bacterium]